MKQGRPKNPKYAKNRAHTIILSENAELIYKERTKLIGNSKWLNDYLSIKLVDDFLINPVIFWNKERIRLEAERDIIEEKLREIAKKIQISAQNQENLIKIEAYK